MGASGVSILVLTLNEERNLADCLASVAWSDDIVVLDSYSTDDTTKIAAANGARVVQRRFDDWAAHQNWATQNIAFKHDWLFYIDADERMTPALKDEIDSIARDPARKQVAYYCGRKNFFMGKWIKHAMPPGMLMRFFRPQHVRFERLVNPVPVVSGQSGYLSNYLEHYNFSKGLTEWFDKHNKYSLLEAMEGRKTLTPNQTSYSLLDKDRFNRRQALKRLSVRMPLRAAAKFVYLYVLERGFLDGRAGLTYCVLQSIYEYMIALKMRELERRERGLPV